MCDMRCGSNKQLKGCDGVGDEVKPKWGLNIAGVLVSLMSKQVTRSREDCSEGGINRLPFVAVFSKLSLLPREPILLA